MECCGKAAAFVLRIRLAAPTLFRLPNLLCRFTSRFARSVWKTERLWTERLWSAAAKPQLSCCEFAWPRRLALIRQTYCVGSHVASLAQFGKLSDYGLSDYGVLRQSRSFRAAYSPGRADILSFAELIASVHTLLRSLSLEN